MRSMILLGYRDFFTSGALDDKLDLANKIGSDDILNAIGHFMGGVHKQGIPDAADLLKQWFTYFSFPYTSSPTYTMMEQRIDALQRMNPSSRYTFISVEAILRMYLWLREQDSNLNKQGTVKDASLTIDLFKLMLLFNQDVLNNIQKGRDRASQIKDELALYRIALTLAFSSNDFVNVDLAQIFASQIYKAARLMEYMEVTPKYQTLHKKVLADFGCASNKEYIQAIGGIIAGTLSPANGKTTIILPDGPDKQKNIDLFEKLAIQPSMAPAEYDQDFKELRTTPLYKIMEGEYRVIYDPFLINVIYNGLLFYCSSTSDADKSLLNGRLFITEIRQDFSEGVLLYELADCIFNQPSDIKLDGNQVKAIVGAAGRESDYYVYRDKKIALFESKDFFMPGIEKLSYDFSIIESGLKKNGRLAKAVLQSATNVMRSLLGVYPSAGVLSQDISIYPIVIVHSPLYSCPTLNFWANQWFEEEMASFKKEPQYANLDTSKVLPITIVEIDTLILYEQQFKDGSFDFFGLIDAYHQEINLNAIPTSQTLRWQHAMNQLPFAEFVRRVAHLHHIDLDLSRMTNILSRFGIS